MDRATSLIKALDLLTILGGHPAGYTIQQLSEALNRPRSTVVRVLNSLVEYGLVAKECRHYRCTVNFAHWAKTDRYQEYRLRYRPILQAAAEATGELVLLGMKEGAGIVHIDYIESDQAVRVAPAPHTRHNLRNNALGKLCIAERPDLTAVWKKNDPTFAVELDSIRESGLAWNQQESVSGMVALATYGFTRGTTEPKIAIAWPLERFNEENADAAVHIIRGALEANRKPRQAKRQ